MSFHGLLGAFLISPDRRSRSTESETWNATYDSVLNWPIPSIAHRVLAETAVSISERKKNPMVTVAAGDGMAVAVLNRNEPAFTWVRAQAYEELMDRVEDLGARLHGRPGWQMARSR